MNYLFEQNVMVTKQDARNMGLKSNHISKGQVVDDKDLEKGLKKEQIEHLLKIGVLKAENKKVVVKPKEKKGK